MTKSQRAMAVAMIYPKPKKGGRGKKSKLNLEFSAMSLSMARTVLEVLPELAAQVRDRAISLNEAYEKAQFERRASEAAENSLQSLRKTAPDLADLQCPANASSSSPNRFRIAPERGYVKLA